jgi:malonyl-CoA O-methyltransferase
MRHAFSRAAARYDQVAVLARETGRRLAERLDWVKLTPARSVDLGCATGDGVRELQRRYPAATAIAVDFSLAMLAATRQRTPPALVAPLLINADARCLPLATTSVDLVWSNLVLHWLDDPQPAFREVHRILSDGGLFSFAMFGPDTLKELRAAGAGGARRFFDMHDIGDMLIRAGFAEPVLDVDIITLGYGRRSDFLSDQRQLGVRDGLLGELSWRQGRQVFRNWRCGGDGRWPASFEIVFGHAWQAPPAQVADGRSIVQFHRP